MRVMFAKSDDGRLCSWRAELPGHRWVRGSTMAARSAGTTRVGPELDAVLVRWRALRPGDELVVE